MSNTIEQLQVLYEIAMSIGLSLDLRLMLKTSLSVLLKKLSCSAGGVLFFQPRTISTLTLNGSQEIHFEEVFNVPRSIAHNKAYQAALRRLPKSIPAERLDVFFQQLPLSGQEDPEGYFYIFELPDIGLLILTKYGEGLDFIILKSLKPLLSKLAGACKACLQNAELHESKENYRSIFENVQDVYIETCIDGTIVEVSPSIESISKGQYKRTDLIGKSIYKLYSDTKDRDALLEALQKTGSVVDFEVSLKNRDASIIFCSISAKMILNSERQPEKIIGSIHDITERKQTEEALRESEARLKDIVYSMGDWVWEVDVSGRYTFSSKKGSDLLGCAQEDIIGKTPFDFMSPEEVERVKTVFSEIASNKAPIKDLENWNIGKNGERFCLLTNGVPILDENGNLRGYRGVDKDITQRKRAEEEIESQARFPSENPNPIMRVEQDGKIIYANAASEVLLCFWNCEVGEYLPPEWRERIVNITRSSVITTVEVEYEEWVYSIMVVPIPVPGYVNLYGRDITKRKRAEEALRETTDYLGNLLSFASAPIMVWDRINKITKFNLSFERLTGYTMYDVLGKNPETLFSDDKREEISTLLSRTKDGENILSVELPVRCKDGNTRIVLWNTANIYTKDAKTITATIAIGQDITDRKQLEEGLRQLQKMEELGTLAGGIAHDFNNILGIILAYITSTHQFKDDAKKFDLAVNTIVKAVERGKTIVQQILMFARKTETEFGPVNVNEIVMEMMTMIFETFPKNLTYAQNFDKSVSYISADRSQLHQVMLNLCVNARDAMPSGGVLAINTRKVSAASLLHQHSNADASSYVCIEVVDTGEGMSDEIRKRIFEPFFTTKEIGKGTGLGMSVVFGIIQNHKGFIDVESKLGKGTTFSVYLPELQVAEPVSVKVEETLEEIPGGTEMLLVVEDEEMLLMSLQMILGEKGYKVLSAKDGLTAVNIFKERNKEIALVLTDIGLPMMSGMEECVQIKKLNPNARMIVATGFLDSGMKSEFLKVGVQKFLFKPYDLKQVLKEVRVLLDEK